MPTDELDDWSDWSDVRDWLTGGNAPVSAPIVRRLLSERDALARACHEMQIEIDLLRRTGGTSRAD